MTDTHDTPTSMVQVGLSPESYRALMALTANAARDPDGDASPLLKKALAELRRPVPALATLDDAIIAMNDVVSDVVDAGELMLRTPNDPGRQEALRRALNHADEAMNSLFEGRPERTPEMPPLPSAGNAVRPGMR